MDALVPCPVCRRQWTSGTRHSICIEFFGQCVCCRFTLRNGFMVGTWDEVLAIEAEYKTRRNHIEYVLAAER